MLKLEQIRVSLDGGVILYDIDATITSGDFIIIVGHNGSGKSTLLEVISGAIIPQQGRLLFEGADITYLSRRERMAWMGLLYQDVNRGVVNTMTVSENIALARYKNKTVGLQDGFDEVQPYLEQFQYTYAPNQPVLKKSVSQLSGGQRQVLAFFMATMMQPHLLLCDEPTAALDPLASQRMMTNINQFAQSHHTMTVMVTHELEDAINYGNRLWIMKQGRLAMTLGPEKQLLTPHQLKSLLQ